MYLSELYENQQKHAAFCFGRMNPPTIGHAAVIDKVEEEAHGGDYFIFVSQSQDAKKNPLDYKTKVSFIKKMFPQQAGHVVYDPAIKTVIHVVSYLYDKGYTDVTLVAGSDRLPSFEKMLNTYNGKGQPGDQGYFKFNSINYVSSGDRDPDADGLAGISASLAREKAIAGDLAGFAKATGAGALTKKLYAAVRKGLGIAEDIQPDGAFTTSPIHGGQQYESRGHKVIAKKLRDIELRKKREQQAAKRAEEESKKRQQDQNK